MAGETERRYSAIAGGNQDNKKGAPECVCDARECDYTMGSE